MIIHDIRSGRTSIRSVILGPSLVITAPAGIAPAKAPNVIMEPIHEPSSSVTIIPCEFGPLRMDIDDEVHVKHCPKLRMLNVAVNEKEHVKNIT